MSETSFLKKSKRCSISLQNLPRLVKSLHMATRGFPPCTILVNLFISGEAFRTPSMSIFSLSFILLSPCRALTFLVLLGVGPEGVFSPLLTLDLRFCLTGFDASLFFPFLVTCKKDETMPWHCKEQSTYRKSIKWMNKRSMGHITSSNILLSTERSRNLLKIGKNRYIITSVIFHSPQVMIQIELNLHFLMFSYWHIYIHSVLYSAKFLFSMHKSNHVIT